MGGCKIDESRWFEVFDTKTQSWIVLLPGPGADNDELRIVLSENLYILVYMIDEKFVVMSNGREEYTYELKDGTWKLQREQSNFIGLAIVSSTWINNVIYCCNWQGTLLWRDSEDHEDRGWRDIKGLQRLRDDCKIGLNSACEHAVVEYGGMLMVMWGSADLKRKNKIWYAKISLERSSNGHEIWGTIECVDELTLPCEYYKSFYCLSALA